MAEQDIWFQLLDSVDGTPYKNSPCDAVDRTLSIQTITHFRDAIKTHLADTLLKGITLSNLLIYKNKACFESKLEQPLDQESLLTDLGRSAREALAIVVPTSSQDNLETLYKDVKDLYNELEQLLHFLKRSAKKEFRLKEPTFEHNGLRLEWLIHYGMVPPNTTDFPQKTFCHLLGTRVPTKYLSATHIFQKQWREHARDFGLSGVYSSQNILVCLTIFKQVFDAGQLVLLCNKETQVVQCKILDPALKLKRLDETMKSVYPDVQMSDIDFNGKTYFGDLDGQALLFLNDKRPFMRCMSLHAIVAREYAVDSGWIDKNEMTELDNEDVWQDEDMNDKTRKCIKLFRHIIHDGAREMNDSPRD